jgi:lipopolysaccharide/colanic/teichoic acid biosynthesis glycosyltransferase
LAPAMLAVTLLLLTFDRSGPILYRQVRLGRNGKPFNILKFRTMRVDAEANGAQFAVKGDPRVTKLGRLLRRTSLDELPQIFNVLRNDMSIVGPRPERPVFVEEFRRKFKHYDERHLVKPGITGWSQVNMRRVLQSDDVAEKLKHDLFYVENWSPFLDLSVITKTALEFLFHRAA